MPPDQSEPPAAAQSNAPSSSEEERGDDNEFVAFNDDPQTDPRFITTYRVYCHVKETNVPLFNHNAIIMVTVNKQPVDNGAREFSEKGILSPLSDLMLDRARVYPSLHAGRHILVLPIKERPNVSLDRHILDECFISVTDVATELNLHSFSLRKTDKIDKYLGISYDCRFK